MSLKFLNLIFPPRCLNCHAITKEGAICDFCFQQISPHHTFYCGECRARLIQISKTCHPKFPYILGAASNYEEPAIKNLIQGLKFRSVEEAAKPLGQLIINYAHEVSVPIKNAVILPIPLSKKRERQRGFNQSTLIAKFFADCSSLPLVTDCLIRVRHSSPQSELKNYEERRQNVKNCFAIQNSELIQGKNVILVDDVVTSGATLKEAAIMLKMAGARKIIALTVAMA